MDLHIFSFIPPTLWAVMSKEGVAYFASKMRNGVTTAESILLFYSGA
jgi:hypothetical protein